MTLTCLCGSFLLNATWIWSVEKAVKRAVLYASVGVCLCVLFYEKMSAHFCACLCEVLCAVVLVCFSLGVCLFVCDWSYL